MSMQEKRTLAAEQPEKVASLWLAVLALAFLVPWAHGQAASPPEPAPSQVSGVNTHVNVDEVSLDLVVHDKSHKLVLDLKPEDVVVTDDGTPVKLTGFHLVNGEAGNGQVITLVFDRFEGPTAKSVESIAEKIVRMFPEKGFSFAVLDYSGRLRLIQGFTGDRQVVEQAVSVATESKAVRLESTATQDVSIVNEKAEEGRSKAASEAEKNLISIATTGIDSQGAHVSVKDRARSQTLLAALEDSQRIVQDQHAYLPLAGLMALAHSQAQLTERKSVVYFTQNYQMNKTTKDYLRTITGAANRAGVSVYVIDMNALNTEGQGQTDINNAMLNGQVPYEPTPGTMQQPTGIGAPTTDVGIVTDFSRQSPDKNPLSDTRSPMAQFATATGGAYIDALSTVKKPLDQMLEDMTTYYQATYIPPIQEYDGKFRPIAVRPLRGGLVVETKTGYLALPPSAEGDIRPFEVPLMKILGQTEFPSALKFHAAILKFGELPDGNANTFAVEVPMAALEARKDTKTAALSEHVSIVAQIKDKSGTVVEHYGEDITRRGTLNTAQEAKTGVVEFQRHFMSVPGQYSLEVAVLDNNSGTGGAQRIDFEIPETPASPSLSDMVLVRQMDAFNPLTDPLEPLRYENVKVTPSLAGVATGDGKSLSLFFILHPDPKATEPPTLEMQVFHDGKPGRRTPLPLKKVGNGAAIPYLATFKDSSLAPGHYEVMARITQSGRSSENEILFSVEGSQAAAAPGVNRTTPQ